MKNNEATTKEPFDLHIIDRLNKIPGGFLLAPLLIAVIITSFFPSVFQIGGITTALFIEGGNCTMALFLICCGSMINVRQVGLPLYKGTIMTAIKLVVGVLIGMLLNAAFGPAGIFGITPMIAIAAITNSNSSLYIILAGQFGDATDSGAISVLCLNDGPFFTLVALGATGLASFDVKALVAVLFPLLIGFVWGNMDSTFKNICKSAQPLITFFMIFPIASRLTFKTLFSSGIIGVILGLISAALGFLFFFLVNLLLPKKEQNAMGAAIGTTAGNAAMTPAAIAAADPTYAGSVESATAMISTASIITLLLCPFITTLCDNYMKKKKLGIYSPEGRVGKLSSQAES